MIETATARRIDTVEVAKMIRRHLKAEFSGVTFSVRSSRYSGGSSIDIRWTDGPTADAVEKWTRKFSGAGFDGMIDLKYYYDSWYCPKHGARTARIYGHSYDNGPTESRCCAKAELVKFGADYVHTSRTLSPAFRKTLEDAVAKEWGTPYDENKNLTPGGNGALWMSTEVYRKSREVSA